MSDILAKWLKKNNDNGDRVNTKQPDKSFTFTDQINNS